MSLACVSLLPPRGEAGLRSPPEHLCLNRLPPAKLPRESSESLGEGLTPC